MKSLTGCHPENLLIQFLSDFQHSLWCCNSWEFRELMCSLQEVIIVLISHAPKLYMDKTEAFKSQKLQCLLLKLCQSDPTNKIVVGIAQEKQFSLWPQGATRPPLWAQKRKQGRGQNLSSLPEEFATGVILSLRLPHQLHLFSHQHLPGSCSVVSLAHGVHG